jgi:hypothetical protein
MRPASALQLVLGHQLTKQVTLQRVRLQGTAGVLLLAAGNAHVLRSLGELLRSVLPGHDNEKIHVKHVDAQLEQESRLLQVLMHQA